MLGEEGGPEASQRDGCGDDPDGDVSFFLGQEVPSTGGSRVATAAPESYPLRPRVSEIRGRDKLRIAALSPPLPLDVSLCNRLFRHRSMHRCQNEIRLHSFARDGI